MGVSAVAAPSSFKKSKRRKGRWSQEETDRFYLVSDQWNCRAPAPPLALQRLRCNSVSLGIATWFALDARSVCDIGNLAPGFCDEWGGQ